MGGAGLLAQASLGLLLVLAGCAGPVGPEKSPDPAATVPRCEGPWPCADGSEWDSAVRGPFSILDPLEVRVPSFDGVELYGAIWRPDVPADLRVPVILESSPYHNQDDNPSPASPTFRERNDLKAFVEAGYAFAMFNVRGTGHSGGCYDHWGTREQRDQALLVEWLAQQPWSNGRIGMYGISYMGTTPWEAAIQDPPALKAIITAGIITDVYELTFSPQGAAWDGSAEFETETAAEVGVIPQTPQYAGWMESAAVVPERACPDVAEVLGANYAAAYGNDRNEKFWADRRLVDRFPDVHAAALVAHGLLDNGGHRYQEDVIWSALSQAPKAMILGNWGHELFFDDKLAGHPYVADSIGLYLRWFDFWLKGVGDAPPELGSVTFQDDHGAWHRDAAWPPTASWQEVLFLSDEGLSSTPSKGAWSFQAGRLPADDFCSNLPGPPSRYFKSASPAEPATIAGNPFLFLQLTTDQPGGEFRTALYDVPADWAPCADDEPVGLTLGAVDLRFHHGNMVAEPFPTGQTRAVRADFFNLAHVLEPGRALLLLVTNADDQEGAPFAPTITLTGDGSSGSSHLVLPLVAGTFGGTPPSTDYPPRPFSPS